METFYFQISQQQPVPVSIAFDDIEIGKCDIISPTSSTSTVTTTTVTTTITATASTSTQIITTYSSSLSITTASTRSDAQRLLFVNEYHLIIISFLLRFIQ
jgi:hypothetical protein